MTLMSVELFLWFASAFVGAGFATWAAIDAHKDVTALRVAKVNGTRELIAKANRRREIFRLLMQVGFLAIGFASLGDDHRQTNNTVGEIVLAFVFITAAWMLTAQTILDRRLRLQIARLLASGE